MAAAGGPAPAPGVSACDGDLDIVTTEFHAEPQILISDLAQRRRPGFVSVKLVGRRSAKIKRWNESRCSGPPGAPRP